MNESIFDMHNGIISTAFDYYTEQYREHIKYCEILDDAEEKISGIGYVRRQMLYDRKDNITYSAMKINGICVEWHKVSM